MGNVEGDAELFWCEVLSFLLLLGSHIGLSVLKPAAQVVWDSLYIYISLMSIATRIAYWTVELKASRSTHVKFVFDVSSAVDVLL